MRLPEQVTISPKVAWSGFITLCLVVGGMWQSRLDGEVKAGVGRDVAIATIAAQVKTHTETAADHEARIRAMEKTGERTLLLVEALAEKQNVRPKERK